VKDIHDVIKHAKFGDDRLRGSGAVAGQISAFPIDFVGRPYNTLTLPCERVIQSVTAFVLASVRSVNVIIFHMHSTAGLDATFADSVKNFVTLVSTCYIHTPL